MKPPPQGWPRISSALYYDDPLAAIDWLCKAFDFEIQLKVLEEDGTLAHSELVYGGGLIMVSSSNKDSNAAWHYRASPLGHAGINTQNLMLYVEDVEAHFERAKLEGAIIVSELKTTNYGEEYWTDRGYEAADPEGHHWWFYQRLSNHQ